MSAVLRRRSRRQSSRYLLLLIPMAAFSAFVVFAPLVVLLVNSLIGATGVPEFSSYKRIFVDSYTLQILLSTLKLGVIVTIGVAIISYPIALALTFASPRQRAWLLILIVLPLLTSTVVRTFAWIVIFGRDGPLNQVLLLSGLVSEPQQMLFSEAAVIVAIAQIELPLMILPLATSLLKIDPNLLASSHSLGAGRWRTFCRIIFPLGLPGLLAGCTLVFASSVSAFITQTVVGGGKRVYMPLLIYQQAIDVHDFRSAAALAMLLLFAVAVAVIIFGALGRAARSNVVA
jgi:putative spermidine/putrescine transport system permease protein